MNIGKANRIAAGDRNESKKSVYDRFIDGAGIFHPFYSRFVRHPAAFPIVSQLAVSRDGTRFYFPQAVEQPDSDLIHVRTGWAK